MNKICTSLEQSKKLIELGIDISTADMFYSSWTILANGEYILSPLNGETVTNLQSQYGDQIIPAWSLSALLDLIPDIIEDYVLRIDKVDGEYFIWYDKIGEGWSDAIAHPSSENFIDAAFEMIVWLKENEKI